MAILLAGLFFCDKAWAGEVTQDQTASGAIYDEANSADRSIANLPQQSPAMDTASDATEETSSSTDPATGQSADGSENGEAVASVSEGTNEDDAKPVVEAMLSVAEAAYEEKDQLLRAMESVTEAAYLDVVMGVTVNFEYSSDSNIINPHITVKDEAGNSVVFNKRYNLAYRAWEMSFKYPGAASAVYQTGDAEGSVAAATYADGETVATAVYTFRVTVSAPGYKALEQEVQVSRDPTNPADPIYYGNAVFNLEATPGYRLGREITRKADELLNFAAADGVLCITTAGSVHYQGNTSEDVLEGILNEAHGIITFGQGNLLMLRKTRVDPIDFAFVVKKGTDLRLAYFKNGSLSPVYVGTISQNMSSSEWATVSNKLGSDAFPIASLANAWAIGLSSDILREAAFHGHVCLGTISGYAMIETLLKYYPPVVSEGGVEATSYQVLGVPGGSDDDVFLYAMDATPGKRAYIGIDTIDNKNIVGFIRWNSKTKTGTLIIMKFDEQALVQQFKEETGITVVEDTLTELKFNAWLVEKLKTSPESLVTIVKALDGLNEEQYYYLMGYEPTKGNTIQQAHGLDMDYINSLGLPEAIPANVTSTIGKLTPEEIKQIGIDAAMKAIELFLADGLKLEKDDPNLLVLTSAGYVRLNGQVTDMTWDGIYEVLGSRLSRATLLPVHSALWKELWFEFTLRDPDTKTIIKTVTIYYDPNTEQLKVTSRTKGATIAEAWIYEPPYDALMAWLFHNHTCGGSAPGYLIADYIFENYPLGEDEKYIYVTTNDNCKDDILVYLLGISPGAGTYYNLRLTSDDTRSDDGTMVGVLIKWNEETQVGTAVIISWKSPRFEGGNYLSNYIPLYKGETPANMVSEWKITTTEKLITAADLATILSGAAAYGNPLKFVMGLPDRNLSDLIPAETATPEQATVHAEEPKAEGAPPAPPAPSGSPMTPPAEAAGAALAPATVTAGSTPGPEPERVTPTPAVAEAVAAPSPASAPAVAKEAPARAYEVKKEPAAAGRGAVPLIAVLGAATLVALGAAGYFLTRRKRV